MKADLYGVLGVDRGADAAEVRRAYRRASKASHPDGGGSVERFQRVHFALEVLSDPVRRQRYDETGEAAETVVDTRRAEAMNMIAGALDQVVQESGGIAAAGFVDLVQLAIAALERRRAAGVGQLAQNRELANRWEKLAERFRAKDSERENVLRGIALGKAAAARGMVRNCEKDARQCTDAIELLREHRFEPEKQYRAEGPSFGSPTLTTAWYGRSL